MIILLMGVCGCGKTTIGMLLAEKLNCGFSDADDFHPKENVEKMRVGIPLQDQDRWPWLKALRKAIDQWQTEKGDYVLACSALKETYRNILSPNDDILFVFLKGNPELITQRMQTRTDHYMNPSLIKSQFLTLEEPSNALVMDIAKSPEQIVEEILQELPINTQKV